MQNISSESRNLRSLLRVLVLALSLLALFATPELRADPTVQSTLKLNLSGTLRLSDPLSALQEAFLRLEKASAAYKLSQLGPNEFNSLEAEQVRILESLAQELSQKFFETATYQQAAPRHELAQEIAHNLDAVRVREFLAIAKVVYISPLAQQSLDRIIGLFVGYWADYYQWQSAAKLLLEIPSIKSLINSVMLLRKGWIEGPFANGLLSVRVWPKPIARDQQYGTNFLMRAFKYTFELIQLSSYQVSNSPGWGDSRSRETRRAIVRNLEDFNAFYQNPGSRFLAVKKPRYLREANVEPRRDATTSISLDSYQRHLQSSGVLLRANSSHSLGVLFRNSCEATFWDR